MDQGNLRIFQGDMVTNLDFTHEEDPFITQAQVFLDSIRENNCCRNTPSENLGDLYAIEAIVKSAREYRTIKSSILKLLYQKLQDTFPILQLNNLNN